MRDSQQFQCHCHHHQHQWCHQSQYYQRSFTIAIIAIIIISIDSSLQSFAIINLNIIKGRALHHCHHCHQFLIAIIAIISIAFIALIAILNPDIIKGRGS